MIYDERDTIFSRLRLEVGSKEFEEYYLRKPENKEVDMKLKKKRIESAQRKMKSQNENDNIKDKKPNKMEMIGFNSNCSDHEYAVNNLVKEYQRVAAKINKEAFNMSVNSIKRELPPETMTLLVKEFVRLSGIDVVGITKIDKNDLYSNSGFTNEFHKYGEEINIDYKYAIVFAVPLEKDYINRSPNKELPMSAMLGYAKSSEVAARLTMYIKDYGFDAMTDSSFSYQSPISFLAEKAGLGQMGRCNAVVNQKYGNRTKLAGVLTNLPLIEDGRVDFGLKEFCDICGLCQKNCPVKAISLEASISENGEKYWEHDSVACMEMWTRTGTSCGICMSACPFSQGVDEELVSKMKGNIDVMNEILEEHNNKYGRRKYINQPLAFMHKK